MSTLPIETPTTDDELVALRPPMDESVLLVEDDPAVRETASLILRRGGLRVDAEHDGEKAVQRFQRGHYDIVVLDVMLPSLDGFCVCREIRRTSAVPIVMLTAKTATADVVAGLELGADDYLTKPFEAAELLARVRANLRRSTTGIDAAVQVFGDLEIDVAGHKVRQNGNEVALSATEFRLLAEMASEPGRVFSRQALLERVWKYDYLGDSRLVDMAVRRLREKLDIPADSSEYITTVRGAGYRFEPPSHR